VIRAFIAVEIDPATARRIAAAVQQLKPRIAAIRWVGAGNFHLTLRFLGNIDESRIEAIGSALTDALRPFPRFTINAKGLGVFPNPKRPRVLWVGLVGSHLVSLQAKVESALTPLGFAPEEKSFTPHLTIGRWRQGERADQTAKQTLDQELGKWSEHEFGVSPIEEVILFQSDLKPGGAIYRRLKVVVLQHDRVP
jgi:RNA 2',3'-cyclic 3'-phosphodiesterase